MVQNAPTFLVAKGPNYFICVVLERNNSVDANIFSWPLHHNKHLHTCCDSFKCKRTIFVFCVRSIISNCACTEMTCYYLTNKLTSLLPLNLTLHSVYTDACFHCWSLVKAFLNFVAVLLLSCRGNVTNCQVSWD